MTATAKFSISRVTSDGVGPSYFDHHDIELSGPLSRQLSERQAAQNFRLRYSDPSYGSDFHVAGDPTLLVILKGCVEIKLRSGQSQRFKAGEMFIASDFMKEGLEPTDIHGHSAKVIGDEGLQVLHLKLSVREA